MRTTYLWLARLISLLVVVQAMAITFAYAGLSTWISKGHTVGGPMPAGRPQARPAFTGSIGNHLHGLLGERVIPAVALLLLIVALFAKVPKGVAIAAGIFVLVVLQTASGIKGHGLPYLGLWHGLGAFLIFGAAMAAAMLAKQKGSVPNRSE